MMKSEYVVLSCSEAMAQLRRLRSNPDDLTSRSYIRPEFDLLRRAEIEGIALQQDFSIKQERLTAPQAAELSQKHTVLVIAPVMPVSLIAPIANAVRDRAAVAETKRKKIAWGVRTLGADKSKLSGVGVTVAILDTGINPKHSAFGGMELLRRNFSRSGNLDDEHGHGTHCAGTIFGRDVAGVRIGIACGVTKAFIAKVLDKDGHGSSSGVVQAIEWAIENNANVVSMSLGFDFPGMVATLQTESGLPPALAASRALRAYRDNLRLFDSLMMFAQARNAFGAGSVFVAASGNESKIDESPDYQIECSLPAASNGIISVGALGKHRNKLAIAPFSNINPTLSAPGIGIVSAGPPGIELAAMSGTSMACPHVAGAAALWWEHLRALNLANGQRVAAQLIATARVDVFSPGFRQSDHGAGLVSIPG